MGERKESDIPANRFYKEDVFSAEISKLVMRLGRHFDQNERESDSADHWGSMESRLRNAFLKHGSSEFSDLDWKKTSLGKAARSGSSIS